MSAIDLWILSIDSDAWFSACHLDLAPLGDHPAWVHPSSPIDFMLMALGAVLANVSGEISLFNAFKAINLDVILYLFGVFVLSQALEDSGTLAQLGTFVWGRAQTASVLLVLVVVVGGLSASLLTNDTAAILGVPLLLALTTHNQLPSQPFLLAFAYALSIGSVMSPIGNPQNLLIATQGDLNRPFATFLGGLFWPTLLCLGLVLLVLWIRFGRQLANHRVIPLTSGPVDRSLSRLCWAGLALLLLGIGLKLVLIRAGGLFDLPFAAIGLVAGAPVLLFSRRRLSTLKRMDWSTLLFFVGLFVLIQAVWNSGVLQSLLERTHVDVTGIPQIVLISSMVSQLISNVPLVELYLPLLNQGPESPSQLLALAAGSTAAGTLSVFGAASNIIILQSAEQRGSKAFSIIEFTLIGLPLGLACLAVYGLWLV